MAHPPASSSLTGPSGRPATTQTQLVPSGGADPRSRLITAIRGYIHMDNLAESFSTQATNARQVRAKHEDDAITLIKELGLQGSTIQVSGATLNLKTSRTSSPLSWGYLEREIPAWATRNGVSAAQSASLLKWLHEHRDMKETEFLKKTVSTAAGTPKATG